MKPFKSLTVIALSCTFSISALAEYQNLSTPSTSLVVETSVGNQPHFVYFGPRLPDDGLYDIQYPSGGRMELYQPYGMQCLAESAMAMTHADGNKTTELSITGWSSTNSLSLPALGSRGDATGTHLVINMEDPVYKTGVNLHYFAFSDVDMILCWTEITNNERKEVLLTQYSSGMLPIRRGNVFVSHLHGSWANEARLVTEKLRPGMLVIKNHDGVRNSHTDHAEVMFSLDGVPQENYGQVIGAALCYSGNFQLRIDTDDTEYHYFYAGINPDNSECHLMPKETFTTPFLALTYSDKGLSGASRNFHRWGRNYQLANGNTPRKILLNSWEGVYFDISQEGMDQMMGDIASMGGELFVMDDGWFGDKYPRKTDNSSLGDWVVDRNKLPEGIEGLLRDARKHGIRFGIWIEPEMANTTSELYEKHPDWVIRNASRRLVQGRGGTQVVLDLSNPDVQDYVFSIVDNLMTEYPEIDYIKWDANMSIDAHGSQYLPRDRQSHLFIEYHRGFEKVCRRIREKYPDLTIQACASGGGRANWGVMPYFDEFWVSDDTDALQRIFMQWGTSYFFPAMCMASHISNAPNHQTFRTVPLKFRIDVAMSGRLGMEIQPKNMTDEEKALCRKAISDYKSVRDVVQMGDIYRLNSPYDDDNLASLMYVAPDRSQAVFYWYRLEHFYGEHFPLVRMQGLDPNRRYTVSELNRIDNRPLSFEGKSFTGEYLMTHGLEIPYKHTVDYHKQNDWSSRVLRLNAED